MEKDIKDKIEYIVICISEFAKKPKLMLPESFNYLRSWKGIDFLDKGYEVGHLFSIEDAVDDLTADVLHQYFCTVDGKTVYLWIKFTDFLSVDISVYGTKGSEGS